MSFSDIPTRANGQKFYHSWFNLLRDAGISLDASVGTLNDYIGGPMTTAARDAIVSPATGLLIYNTTTNYLNMYNGSGWISSADAATAILASTVTTNANLTGEATSVGNAVTLTNASVIAKLITGYTSGAGLVAATDSILQAIQKLNGNILANNPLTTTGDMVYSSGGSTPTRLGIGSPGQIVKVVAGLPAWGQAPTGGINYLATNYDAEVDTSGWTTYADAAQNTPVDGVGGSPSSTWTRTTSSPLRGTASFLWTRSAANRQGEGVAYSFTADAADQGRTISITFDYKIVSGTFFAADGVTAPSNDGTTTVNNGMSDLEVFIRDNTNGVLLPVSPQVLTSVSAINASFKGTCQLSSNSTSYSLILHTARSTAVAFSAAFDNFYCGPQIISYGCPVTDWQSYTPVLTSFGTPTAVTFLWRRVGGSVEISGNFTPGTPTGVTAQIGLPTGLTTSSSIGAVTVFGQALRGNTNSNNLCLLAGPSVSVFNLGVVSVAGNSPFTIANGNGIVVSGDVMSVRATIPIQGWSSSTQMSNDAATTVIAARASASGVRNPTSAKALNYDTITFDPQNAITVMSGDTAGWKYTAPVSGYYDVSIVNIVSSAIAASMILYRNGSAYGILCTINSVNINSGSTSLFLTAGDYIDVRSDSTPATITLATGVNISIKRLSGPSAISVSDPIRSQVKVVGGNGYGSTNTVIRRFTSLESSVGQDITYADSATLGATFTLNTGGLYSFTFQDANSTNQPYVMGLSKNSNQLTTGIGTITATHKVAYKISPCGGADWPDQLSGTVIAAPGDVIRAHNQATLPTGTTLATIIFTITKMAN